MVTICPHCQHALSLSDAQKVKLQKAVNALAPGKKLSIKCPSCTKPITFEAGTSLQGPADMVKPPEPPDLNWMKESALQDENRLDDVPMALILFPANKQRDIVKDAIEAVGYQVIFAENTKEARERMRFVNFSCVVLYSRFEGPDLNKSEFHRFMRGMGMSRRRYIFYILIGPEFHTLYNLQALACSANLVINEKDLLQLGVALRRSIPIYEELFGPFMEELTSAGKS